MTGGRIAEAYQRRLARGDITPDPAQDAAVQRLDRLASAILERRQAKAGLLAALRRPKSQPLRGLYIHGAVGRGKTMLMDLFYERMLYTPKRRLHFHAFMAEAHDRIRRGRATTDGDPIPFVASEIAAEAVLLCLDELTITDIADAMIVGRLFRGLFERGLVVVATSNAAPQSLYPNGLNRQLFLPFIGLIQEHMDVLELQAARDFRHDKGNGGQRYFSPLDATARAGLDAHWVRLTRGSGAGPMTLDVKGRDLRIPLAANGAARFSFDDLCERPLGSLDYLAIADAFHTVLIDDIPCMTPDRRNAARRFIHLVDTLYDTRTGLIASAEAEPGALYPVGDGAVLFERTASRLIEMRSESYETRTATQV